MIEALTPKEVEVLTLVAQGYTSNEIAVKLSNSPRTIEGHRVIIRDKTGMTTGRDFFLYALETGLLDETIGQARRRVVKDETYKATVAGLNHALGRFKQVLPHWLWFMSGVATALIIGGIIFAVGSQAQAQAPAEYSGFAVSPTLTPTATATAEPIATEPGPMQAAEVFKPMMTATATPQVISGGKFWFDVYSLDDGEMAGKLRVSEIDEFVCSCQAVD